MSDNHSNSEHPDEVKFGFYIPKELNDKLNSALPWGVKSEAIRCLVTVFAELVASDGPVVVHRLLAGELTLADKSDVHLVNTTLRFKDKNEEDK